MIEKLRENWDEILLYLKEEHDIMDVSYRTWLLPLQLHGMDGDKVVVIVPDSAMISYIMKKYGFFLKIAIEEKTGIECEVDFISKEEAQKSETSAKKAQPAEPPQDVSPEALQNANLNPKYTFDTFVVGANNNLAHAASLAVAESPGEV